MVTQILRVIYFSLVTTLVLGEEKWSRQSSTTNIKNLADDWIPIATNEEYILNLKMLNQSQVNENNVEPKLEQKHVNKVNRAANARVLTHSHNAFLASNNRHTIQQRSPQFNFVHPLQFSQYQQNQKNQPLQQQHPTSQSFFKFEMPSFALDGTRINAPSVQTGYQIEHSFGPVSHPVMATPLLSQKQIFSPELQQTSQHQPLIHTKVIQQNFEDNSKHIKDSKVTQGNLVAQQHDFFSNHHQHFQLQKPTTFQAQLPNLRQQQSFKAQPLQSSPFSQSEEVQLLYVPYDSFYSNKNDQQPQIGFNNERYNLVQEPVNPVQINNFYTQDPVENPGSNAFISTTTSTLKPFSSTFNPSENFQKFLNPRFLTSKSTVRSKPKPHQPPLAMFYQKMSARTTTNDVVNALSSTKSISVLDAPSKSAPQVFVGPAGLPTPLGYSKFELPYLSSFSNNKIESNLKETPFFVAPLSYKTPFGFEKIVLPEPHVGSIVINKPKNEEKDFIRASTMRPQQPLQEMYITPLNENSTPRQHTSTRLQSSPSSSQRWQTEKNRKTQDTTSQNHFQENSGTTVPKDSFVSQYKEGTREVSPFINQQKNKFSRPEPAFRQTVKPYSQFKPMPNNIDDDEYFKTKSITSTILPTIASTSKSASTFAATPQTYTSQTFATNPKMQAARKEIYESSRTDSQSSKRPDIIRHQFYDTSSTLPPTPQEAQTIQSDLIEISKERQTSKTKEKEKFVKISSPLPNPTQIIKGISDEYKNEDPLYYADAVQDKYQSKLLFDEEPRVKTFFQQRRPTISSNTQKNQKQNIPNTPVSFDYENTTTANYYEGSTLRTTTPRITFYHPTAQSNDENIQSNTLLISEDSNELGNKHKSHITELTARPVLFDREITTKATRIPLNHRPHYDNEITVFNYDEKPIENQYDSNPFDLPSELPPLTPNLPGLVNALKENERLNSIQKEEDAYTKITTSTTSRPTRRPMSNRGRRPTARTSTSSSVSYSSSDSVTTRKPINRVRRPFNPKNNTYTTKLSFEDNITTTRSSFIRNPNRIRYNPTPEERKQFRTRNRVQSNVKPPNNNKHQEDNIEYQRDVLKQNYPVFKQSNRKPSFTTTEKMEDVVTVTPNILKDSFPGLLEPMQIAQQYQQQIRDNYGPGYFPNEEELIPTEPFANGIHTTTLPTTTSLSTEAPTATTKRSSFFRRQKPRTTTEVPTTTDLSTERYTPRSKTKSSENGVPRKVIRVRSRTRRPHPASTTLEPEQIGNENSYQKVTKFNQDFYNDDYQKESNKRGHVRSKISLEPQESQWSISLTRSDSFKPMNLNDDHKLVEIENEPDIVTVGPDYGEHKLKDVYEFNVSANLGSKTNNNDPNKFISRNSPERKIEPTFEELLEQVMSDIGKETSKTALQKDETYASERESLGKPSKTSNKRRGVWKKVRTYHHSDSFETAESKNLGTHLLNHIYTSEKGRGNNPLKIAEKLAEAPITSKGNLISTTTNLEESDTSTTVAPETLITVPVTPNFQTKVETVTSISEEISRLKFPERENSKIKFLDSKTIFAERENLKNKTSLTSASAKEVESTTALFFNKDYEENENVSESITKRKDEIHSYDYEDTRDDLETQPSLFDEVRSQLKDLFAVTSDDEDNLVANKANLQPRRHEYTVLQRKRTVTEHPTDEARTETTTSSDGSFHKNLMKNVIYATSTSTEVSQETEICYRGRCIKSKKP